MQKLSGKNLLLVGFTLFSMFFGAGNLIFPPHLGAQAGVNLWPAFAGLAVSAVGLPIAGVVAVARAGGLDRLAGRGFDYSCSRVDKNGKRIGYCSLGCHGEGGSTVLCPHGEAVYGAYIRREGTESLKPVSTSQKVRFMVREYTNREVGRIMGDGEEGRMKLIPLVSFSRDQIRVRFQIFRDGW